MPVHSRTFQRFIVGTLPATCLATLLLSGCGTAPDSGKAPSPSSSAGSRDDHDHAHPEEGPHHGHLVELGNEEYHAEVVHEDETGTVTVYLLDGSAKTAVPIDAGDVTINLSHEGKAEQFKLPASPDAGDPAGKSSRFVSQEKHLAQDLDAKGSAAKLVVTINGKQYTGKIEHDHDHDHADHKH
ncbi:hypothetical protein [Planctomicrobium sp. SH527]|uniref:hypothetical protein n=1 Tax=Planctomicrobium sp. SH527 TaxID=3448123 RepID=UPI003F5BDACB